VGSDQAPCSLTRIGLKIYSSREYLAAGARHVLPLYPFWGLPADPAWPREGFADDFIARGPEFLELVDLPDADLAIFPQDWKWARLAEGGEERIAGFVDRARGLGKPVAFFWASDRPGPTAADGTLVFQPSLYRSRRGERDFAVPGFHEDLVALYGDGSLRLREKHDRPTISFCGFAPAPPEPHGVTGRLRRGLGDVKRRRAIARGTPLPEDIYVRLQAIEALSTQRDVDTAIVMREDYNGGVPAPTLDLDRWLERRAEYVENIVESDYVLCARGTGNYSIRLSEALCLGRIPVFVDTDCVLPYDFTIDWPSHGVWLDRRSVGRIGELVARFHSQLSDDEFVELQRRNRSLWEDYLSPTGFFSKLHLHLEPAPIP